jgi:hypothetical protein
MHYVIVNCVPIIESHCNGSLYPCYKRRGMEHNHLGTQDSLPKIDLEMPRNFPSLDSES